MLAAAFLGVLAAQAGWAAYIDNGNGTATDTVTGLMWQQGDAQNDGGGRTWEQALAYCDEGVRLNLADRTDWRLPNVRELASIVADDRHSPTIDPTFSCRSSRSPVEQYLRGRPGPGVVRPFQPWRRGLVH